MTYPVKHSTILYMEKDVEVEDPYQWYEQPTINISVKVEEFILNDGDEEYSARVYCASIDDFNMIYEKKVPKNEHNLKDIMDTMIDVYNRVTDGVSIEWLEKNGFQPT